MYQLNSELVSFVAAAGGPGSGSSAPAPASSSGGPCPSGGDCPIDTPQSELGKSIDDIGRGISKLAGEIADLIK